MVTVDLPKDIKDNVMMTFLNYVYTDHVDLSKMSANEVLLLNQMATDYDLKRLQWICEVKLEKSPSSSNRFC